MCFCSYLEEVPTGGHWGRRVLDVAHLWLPHVVVPIGVLTPAVWQDERVSGISPIYRAGQELMWVVVVVVVLVLWVVGRHPLVQVGDIVQEDYVLIAMVNFLWVLHHGGNQFDVAGQLRVAVGL